MQNDTVVGFILVAVCLVFQVVCKQMGIDGAVTATLDTLIASALFLITGRQIYKNNS